MAGDVLTHSAPLIRWQGDRGTYHLIAITGSAAEHIAMHERLHRLEYGARRGFGSVKVMARVGATDWQSSVFPQKQSSEWILLVSRKIIRDEDLEPGAPVTVELELL
ncbi:DUF1905 domain-containing protein [Pelagerythrobacter marensis]|uniref:DUF1905 domain-containing protein n=1 Tax=Pelagerythrobacter marensis TaxID=543877 RepID=A0A0G3XAY3_9SPHN|nr:DUF1905 domain-containing protein [Pelagerythrobacter marensis]AKM07769.1 hypothetical protein AM2010_1703 [Pelagerythrobacter marensis]